MNSKAMPSDDCLRAVARAFTEFGHKYGAANVSLDIAVKSAHEHFEEIMRDGVRLDQPLEGSNAAIQ
jgi:hypothetical protein